MTAVKFRRVQTSWCRQLAVAGDVCPECGGDLDEGYECNSCGFDASRIARAINSRQRRNALTLGDIDPRRET